MALTLSECRTKLQPWILANIETEKARWIWDTQFTDILNSVARDFNAMATIHRERFYRKTDADTTNYELDRDVVGDLYLFRYESDNYINQHYTIVQTPGTPFLSTIVLEDTPDADIQMDIYYLGQIADVSSSSDEIDLPNPVLYDFLELVKAKIRQDFGNAPENYYAVILESLSRQAQAKIKQPAVHNGGMSSWLELDSDDDQYHNITDHYVGQENVVLDAAGSTYEWIT